MQIKHMLLRKEQLHIFVSGLISVYEAHRLAGNFAVIVVVIVVL